MFIIGFFLFFIIFSHKSLDFLIISVISLIFCLAVDKSKFINDNRPFSNKMGFDLSRE